MPSPKLVQFIYPVPEAKAWTVGADEEGNGGVEYRFPPGESGFNECMVPHKHLDFFKENSDLFRIGKDAEARFDDGVFQARSARLKQRLEALIANGHTQTALAFMERGLRENKVPENNIDVVGELRQKCIGIIDAAKEAQAALDAHEGDTGGKEDSPTPTLPEGKGEEDGGGGEDSPTPTLPEGKGEEGDAPDNAPDNTPDEESPTPAPSRREGSK